MKPLDGLLVIAVEQAVAAPLCTARLLQAGARVIKIERPEGDFARHYDTAAMGDSAYFSWLNQGKESIVLDFKSEDGAKLLCSMLTKADILVQNLAPGALARAGFDHQTLGELNHRLITCDISGYGAHGVLASKPAYDLLVQAESGLISVSGTPGEPGRIGVSVCDISTGITAYGGILEAVIARSNTGQGSHIAISLFDVAADWMAVPYLHARYGGGAPQPAGLRHPSIAPYGGFVCADEKTVLIAVQNEREWVRLCADVFNDAALAQRADFASNNDRVSNRQSLEAEITAHTRRFSSETLAERLADAKIAYGMVNTADDLASHPAFRTIDAITAEGQHFALPAHPVRQESEAKQIIARTPKLGEHTTDITREFSRGDT